MRDILLPVVNPDAYKDRRHFTLSHAAVNERAVSKLHRASESHLQSGSNKTASLGRTKSLSTDTYLKYQQQHLAPPLSAVHQSKVDRLMKKLLKAGVDGDLGMVKFLLRWNQPSKGASNDDDTKADTTAVAAKEKTTCHPLCDCDNCVKMVSKNLLL